MSDNPFARTEDAARVPAFNVNLADLLNQAPDALHPEIARAQTGLSSATSSLPGMISNEYIQLCKERPVVAAGGTLAAMGAGTALLWKAPAMTTHLVGAYGASKLVLTDAPDLLSSGGYKDYAKYGLACSSDLAMVAGTVARYVPQMKRASLILTASGVGGRLLANYLPDTQREVQLNPLLAKPTPLSEHFSVNAPLKSSAVENRPYDAFIPQKTDKALPVVLMLSGVENSSAPGMEAETGLNRLAQEHGFIAVYPKSKERDQPSLGKIFDWNSAGAGLTITDPKYDDVDYIRSVIDNVKAKANVDEHAIYVVGFSSGGAFAQHLRGSLPGVFAGVGSIHGTLLGTEAKAQDKSAFISVHSDGDHMLPYRGGRDLMTCLLPRVASSQPKEQMVEALRSNGMAGSEPKVSYYNEIKVTEYGNKYTPPIKEYMIQGGFRGGFVGGLIGRGRDGKPATHALDGSGAGGWPVVGDKNKGLDATQLVVEELLKYRRP